jgi:hypothetical protein
MFSSSSEPFMMRSNDMPMTAAGYVAAMVMPARRPRYALAAPRMPVMMRPRITARGVNSLISMLTGTYGRYAFVVLVVPGGTVCVLMNRVLDS